jgi:hypothetical protein
LTSFPRLNTATRFIQLLLHQFLLALRALGGSSFSRGFLVPGTLTAAESIVDFTLALALDSLFRLVIILFVLLKYQLKR